MRELLEQWNRDLLDDESLTNLLNGELVKIDEQFINQRWLGRPPASSEEIRANEQRLGVQLPRSYRAFLNIADGWAYTGSYNNHPGAIRSIGAVEWAKDGDSELVQAGLGSRLGSVSDEEYFNYGRDQDPVLLRLEYLEHCLQISDESIEGGVYLLNSAVLSDDGEWEAWHLNPALPGAYRCRSFEDLIRQQHALLLNSKKQRL